MASEADVNEQVVEQHPRCEIAKTFIAEGECRRLGEVRLDGSLLCVPHAELLRLHKREDSLLGRVFEMDRWLDSTDGEVDELQVRRVGQQRNELAEELRFNQTRMELIHEELLEG